MRYSIFCLPGIASEPRYPIQRVFSAEEKRKTADGTAPAQEVGVTVQVVEAVFNSDGAG
jgi:hypothetical protein